MYKRVEDLTLNQIISLLRFRRAREVIITDYVCRFCPTCHSPLSREYLNYCNHCGQKLSWIKWRLLDRYEEGIDYKILHGYIKPEDD